MQEPAMVMESLEAYVAAVRADHHHQGSLVHGVRAALASGAGSNWSEPSVKAVVKHLEVLQKHLQEHFAREEEGGYLEEALVHAPRLKTEAKRLLAEHPQLLKRFAAAVAAAGSSRTTHAQWPSLAKQLNDAVDALVAHELGENRLLQQAFTTNLDLDE